MDVLAKELEKIGYAIDISFRQHGVVVIKEFKILAGRHAGVLASIGIPAADYPFTAPAGIHVRPMLAPIGQNNINPSPLGPDWQYWSRRLTDWREDRSAHHIISYVNKVFLDA